jgi:signal transduction histidine kinase
LRSVRVRITAIATLVVAAAIVLAGVALVRTVENRLVSNVRSTGQAQLDAASAQLYRGVPPDQLRVVGSSGAVIEVLDDAGRPVSAYGSPGVIVSGAAATGAGAGAGAGLIMRRQELLANSATRISVPIAGVSVPFEVRANEVVTSAGPFTVFVASPLDGVERSIDTLQGSLLAGLPFVVALVAFVAWIVVGRALRPVESMRREVEAITADTMHRRVPEPRTADEISRLAHTMNAMLDRLEISAVRQRQFVSDASHELRSPIAAIRAELEVALRSGDRANWPQVAEGLLEEEQRLEALVSDLLLLASVDEQELLHDDTPIDLVALARDEAARSRRVPVAVDARDRVFVKGRAAHLTRVIGNLLDNATRFAHRTVALSIVTEADDTVRVIVDDDGAGIPVHERERVFERFARLDHARARGAGGAGLGLALVKGIVERHCGTVCIEDSPIGGARLVVELPVVAPQPVAYG